MIIGFCGRMRSGKAELAKVCEDHGFTRLYFALPLKRLSCKLLGVDIDELDRMKNESAEISLIFGDDEVRTVSDETMIPLEYMEKELLGKTVTSVRELLQFLGTDIIRKYCPSWHVERIREMLDPKVNYVFEDIRFPNEKEMLESLGADIWFIVRPQVDIFSNHESETSITWKDCGNKVIINDGTLSYLKLRWDLFMENYPMSCTLREMEFSKIVLEDIEELGTHYTMSDMMFLNSYMFTYYERKPYSEDIESYKMDGGHLIVKYSDGTQEIVRNPLNIEDYKLYLKKDE